MDEYLGEYKKANEIIQRIAGLQLHRAALKSLRNGKTFDFRINIKLFGSEMIYPINWRNIGSEMTFCKEDDMDYLIECIDERIELLNAELKTL